METVHKFAQLLATIMCGAVLLTGCGRGAAFGEIGTPSSSPAATFAGTTAAPATLAWPERTVLSVPHADLTLVQQPGTPYVYGVAIPNTPVGGPSGPIAWAGPLKRFDLASGQSVAGPLLPNSTQLFTLGSAVELLAPAADDPSGATIGPYSLRRVMGAVTLGPAVPLPVLASNDALVVANQNPALPDHGLWIAAGSHLWLIDAQTGSIERTESFDGRISSLALDPSGKVAYVGLDETLATQARNMPSLVETSAPSEILTGGGKYTTPAVSTRVDELDAATGRTLATHDWSLTTGGVGLIAVDGGVWVGLSYGMRGNVILLGSANLTQVNTPEFIPPNLARDSEAVPRAAVRTDASLWLLSPTTIGCVDPSSGRFLAGTTFASPGGGDFEYFAPFAEWNHQLYATSAVPRTSSTQIIAISPPPGCA
ncbi:MAG TPA: hypothetical protein VHV31_01290 [Nitrolancea sp.]|nr:hypothetical protein [Nitrolancea sp.]